MTARWSLIGPADLPVEEWRPVPGFPDYMVSDRGRVASYKKPGCPILMRPAVKSGYVYVNLRDGRPSQATPRAIHSLVLAAFVGTCPEEHETRHLDGDKTNNALSNLAYGTKSQNIRDQIRHGTHANAMKQACPKGHPYDEANTLWKTGPRRVCRICKRITERAHRVRTRKVAS